MMMMRLFVVNCASVNGDRELLVFAFSIEIRDDVFANGCRLILGALNSRSCHRHRDYKGLPSEPIIVNRCVYYPHPAHPEPPRLPKCPPRAPRSRRPAHHCKGLLHHAARQAPLPFYVHMTTAPRWGLKCWACYQPLNRRAQELAHRRPRRGSCGR